MNFSALFDTILQKIGSITAPLGPPARTDQTTGTDPRGRFPWPLQQPLVSCPLHRPRRLPTLQKGIPGPHHYRTDPRGLVRFRNPLHANARRQRGTPDGKGASRHVWRGSRSRYCYLFISGQIRLTREQTTDPQTAFSIFDENDTLKVHSRHHPQKLACIQTTPKTGTTNIAMRYSWSQKSALAPFTMCERSSR